MRSFVISSFALAAVVALAPSAAFAQSQPPAQQQQQQQQQPPAGQPPAGQQPAGQQPAAPAAPKLTFTTPAGILLVQVKPDQTAVFEEMIGKLKAAFTSPTAPPDVKSQAGAWKIYKASDPGPAGTVLYVMVIDPAVPNTEYQFFEVIQKSLTPAQQSDPATLQMYQKYNAAIAGMNKINIAPVGGGQ